MQEEFNQLESRIDQTIRLYQRLWADNAALREQVLAAQTENRQLNEKLKIVLERLEHMLAAFPQEETEATAPQDEVKS